MMPVLGDKFLVIGIVTTMIATVFAVAYRPNQFGGLLVCWVALSIIAVCSGILPLILVPLALSIISVGCSAYELSRKAATACIASTAFCTMCGIWVWLTIVHTQLKHALETHPVISLEDRLAYERDVRRDIDMENPGLWGYPRIEDRTEFEKLLNEESDGILRRQRSFRSLLRAHQNMETQFALATGFGVIRTMDIPYQHWQIEVPERPLICVAEQQWPDSGNTANGGDFTPWHRQNMLNFAHPVTLGLVDWQANKPDLTRVVGFQPHAFGSYPKPPIPVGEKSSPWRISDLSLVSLLKHRPAAVYVSHNLPNMQKLADAPTRTLDEFEAEALTKLKNGEELVVASDLGELRMLGSIRAAYQCQQCHQVDRGTMLGAFSYRLIRIEPEADSR